MITYIILKIILIIKFAMYEDFKEINIVDEIRNIAKQTKSIDVVFKSYSFYPNEQPFLNIDMAVSMELLRLQAEIREKCDKFSELLPIDFFDLGIWKPDCQLTREIDETKLMNAVNCLYGRKLPIKGKLERIGLIKFHPVKEQIYEKRQQGRAKSQLTAENHKNNRGKELCRH